MKRRYQAKKVRKDKIAYISLCIALVLVVALFASVALEYLVVYNDCKSEKLHEFTGSYILREEPKLLSRGNKLYIYLDNGDILTTVTRLWLNDGTTDQHLKVMEQYPELTFRYASLIVGSHSVYHGVEITSLDGSICLLDIQDTMNNALGVIYFYFIMCLLVTSLLGAVLLCGKRLRQRKRRP